MTYMPETSVIMSVYNTECYLAEAVESILGQTYRDFEFVIINDGSTDGTGRILADFRKKDDRIVILENPRNIGVSKSLNIALRAARGKYIARMDPDDISRKDRLLMQISYMREHPEVGLLGSFIESIDEGGTVTGRWVYPTDIISIKWRLIFSNALAHPSVVYKKDLVLSCGGYDESLLSGIDYDLWVRLSRVTLIHQMTDYLVKWRTNRDSMTYKHADRKRLAQISIIKKQAERYLKRKVLDSEAEGLYRMESGIPMPSADEVRDASLLLKSIHKAFVADNPSINKKTGGRLLGPKLRKLALSNILKAPGVSAGLMLESVKGFCGN